MKSVMKDQKAIAAVAVMQTALWRVLHNAGELPYVKTMWDEHF